MIKELLLRLERAGKDVRSALIICSLSSERAKHYSRVAVSADLETTIDGLYAIGDGAGITRGLLQSSASGVIAARAVVDGAA